MPKRKFDRDDSAFNKLEKAVERLFDLGHSGTSILRSVEIRYNELAGHDGVSEHAVDQAIDRTCQCEPDPEPEPDVTGWCDACGEEVTDPESMCSARFSVSHAPGSPCEGLLRSTFAQAVDKPLWWKKCDCGFFHPVVNH